MGFLKGGLTFSRYRLVQKDAEASSESFDKNIRQFAFRDFFPAEAEKNVGWTSVEDLLDTEFPYAGYSYGDYRLFGLRIDRRSIPPALFKIRCIEEERRFLKENRIKKLYKDQREAIRESVRLRLLETAPPIPTFFEACWAGSGTVLFTSLSSKTVQEFLDLFHQSFGVALEPVLLWDPAVLEAAEISTAQVGREFLTWLWFKSEERGGVVLVDGFGDIELSFVRRLALESGEGEYAESVVCQGQHADLREGKEAVRQGKKIKEARISLGRDSAKWEFTFKADSFHFQSVKLPVPAEMDTEEDEDKSGKVLERLYLIETIIKTMDELFAQYLALRLSGEWSDEVARMQKWASTRDE